MPLLYLASVLVGAIVSGVVYGYPQNHKHKSIRIERLLPFGAIFSLFEMAVKYGIIKRMANKNTTKTRRETV